jgi:hypothetical protein
VSEEIWSALPGYQLPLIIIVTATLFIHPILDGGGSIKIMAAKHLFILIPMIVPMPQAWPPATSN